VRRTGAAAHAPDQRTYALGRGLPVVPRGRHLTIMSILWARGPSTITEIQDELREIEEPEITRQTVQTYLSALRQYEWVRAQPAGPVVRYYPTLSIDFVRHVVIDAAANELFDGSREALLVALIDDRLTHRSALVHARDAIERRLAATAGPAVRRATPSRPNGRPAGSSP